MPARKAAGGGIDGRRTLGPVLWGVVGVVALLLLYGIGTLILRARPDAVATPAPAASPSPKPVARAAAPAAPVRAPAPGTPLARPATVAAFLNSDAPIPQRFSLDTVGFAPGSATLDGTASRALDGIAGVMTTHLNTKIKLAASTENGALAMRRAAAIRAALIVRGVAAYRITTGPSRERGRGSKSGVDLVVLAK